jgi:hypothetical protein
MSATPAASAARARCSVVLVFALCAASSAARAQAPASEPPAAPALAPPAPQPESSSESIPSDAIEARYHGAFEALASGDRDRAVQLLQSIVDAAPDHPLAQRARKLLSDLAATRPPPAAPSSWLPEDNAGIAQQSPTPPERSHPPEPRRTSIARAELVFFQTVHGIALGAEVCAMAKCSSSQPWVLSMMLGAGAGFGASWYFSRDGVTPGLSRALTDGVLWGAANGIGLAVALDATEHASGTAAFLAGGQLVGLGLGGLAYHALEPSAGQVALTSSGGLWSLVATAELVGAFEPSLGRHGWAWLLIGTGNAGVLGGALLARSVPMSTSRVLLIDAGGLLGTLSGLGFSVLAQGDDIHAAPTLIPGVLGTLTGLGVAYYLTRDWDAGQPREGAQLHLGVTPVPNGALASLSGWW